MDTMDTEAFTTYDEHSFTFSLVVASALLVVAITTHIWRMTSKENKCKLPLSELSTSETIRMMTSKALPELLHEQSLILGKVFRLSMPQWRPFVMCMDPQVSKEIFQDATSDKPDLYKVIEIPRGCPVLISKKTSSVGKDSWAAERKAFASCFAKNQYNISNANNQLAKLDLYLEATICDDDGNLEGVSRIMCQYTVDAFAKAAYGIKMNALGGPIDSLGNTFLVRICLKCMSTYKLHKCTQVPFHLPSHWID